VLLISIFFEILHVFQAVVALYRYGGRVSEKCSNKEDSRKHGLSRKLVFSILIYSVIPTIWLIPTAGAAKVFIVVKNSVQSR
jgi:hypothetical protein